MRGRAASTSHPLASCSLFCTWPRTHNNDNDNNNDNNTNKDIIFVIIKHEY